MITEAPDTPASPEAKRNRLPGHIARLAGAVSLLIAGLLPAGCVSPKLDETPQDPDAQNQTPDMDFLNPEDSDFTGFDEDMSQIGGSFRALEELKLGTLSNKIDALTKLEEWRGVEIRGILHKYADGVRDLDREKANGKISNELYEWRKNDLQVTYRRENNATENVFNNSTDRILGTAQSTTPERSDQSFMDTLLQGE